MAGRLEVWEPKGMLISFPVILFGFTAHQFLFGIYGTLRTPSVRRMTGVATKVLLAVCMLACSADRVFPSTASQPADRIRCTSATAVCSAGAVIVYWRLFDCGYAPAGLGPRSSRSAT